MAKNALHLFYRPGACSLAPHILLQHIGADYILTEALRDDSYQAINPTGAVPALDLGDGDILTQCDAILHFICATHDRSDLTGGDDVRQQAEVMKWCAFLTGDFHPAFFPVFVPKRYSTDQSADAQRHVKAAGLELVKNGLDLIDTHLSDRNTFVGNGLTVADFYAVPMLRWAAHSLPDGLAPWPATDAFYQQLCDYPAVRSAMQTQGIAP